MAAVLRRTPPESNAQLLAGLLIGSELLETVRRHAGRPFLLAASPAFLPSYRLALELLGTGSNLVTATVDELRLASVRTHALVLAAVDAHGATRSSRR